LVKDRGYKRILLYGLLALLAVTIHLTASLRWGLGVSHDSVFYLSAARNLLDGNGLQWPSGGATLKPLVHFPPLYPIALSLVSFLIGDINQGAIWISAIFFGVNVLLIAILIYLGTRSYIASLIGGLIGLFSPILLEIHLDMMSEPLYLTCALTALGMMVVYIKSQKRWQFFVAALASSLAFLTRYVGVSVVATGCIALLLWFPGRMKRKLWVASGYGFIAVLPSVIWYVRNYLLTGSFTNRVLSYHPISFTQWKEGAVALASWMLPVEIPFRIRFIVIAIVLLGIGGLLVWKVIHVWHAENRQASQDIRPIQVLILHGVIYSIGLLFSLTFTDASTRLNNRILSPLLAVVLILSVVGLTWVITRIRLRSISVSNVFGFTLSMAMICVYAVQSAFLIEDVRQYGRGFNGEPWRNSQVIERVSALDQEVILYSNEAFSLYYLTEISAYWVPEKYDPVKAEIRHNYEELMKAMHDDLSRYNSALVLFHPDSLKQGTASLEELTSGLVKVFEADDGVIYVNSRYVDFWSDSG
jgi:4-amino-4-deoxy-L-arabinose transferase-like glycosyltransferase